MRTSSPISLIAVVLATATACSSKMTPVGPAPFPQACRTYATRWTATSTFGQPTTFSATFDQASRTYAEVSPADSTLVVLRRVYASVDDFVDESSVLGRVLSVRTESCGSSANCNGNLAIVETPAFDKDRREISTATRISSAVLWTDTFTAWDSSSRPTSGTRRDAGFCAVPIVITYDDSRRIVTASTTGPGFNVLCIGLAMDETRAFDADGNLLSESGATGGTGTTTSHAIEATARLCK